MLIIAQRYHNRWIFNKTELGYDRFAHPGREPNRHKMTDYDRLLEALAGTEGTRLYYRTPSSATA